MGPGRKKREEIWKHYNSGPTKSVTCKYCDHTYKTGNVNKMASHLVTCEKCPVVIKSTVVVPKTSNVKTISMSLSASQDIEHRNISLSEVAEAVPDPIITTPIGGVQKILVGSSEQNMNRTSSSSCESSKDEELRRLTAQFAKAVFISGSPLSMVEHPLWIEFFKSLQPLFPLPSRKILATSLLDKVYVDIKKEVTDNLKTTSYLHLQCDGWTNVNNNGIINFVTSNPEPYFVESLSTEHNRHTSLYLSEQIMQVMQTYEDSKFVVLIGDNARNIQKAFELVKEKKPQIVPLNCAAHTLNLLTHDILKCELIKGIVDLATDVIKTIKKSQILSSLLNKIIKEKKSGETLKLPVKTRWGSHVAALKSLKNTRIALLSLAIHESAVLLPSHTKSTLLDDDFWTMINNCLIILEPVAIPIFQLETNKCNIQNVFMIFKDIKSKLEFILLDINILNNEDKQSIINAVEKRTKDCVKPIHLAAYLLDPKTQGVELNENEDLEAMDFIEQMAQQLNLSVIADLANYKARDGYWSKRILWDKVYDISPITWWKGLCSTKKLSKIAIRILTAPCTSAATERSFSKHGHMHSLKRNRLTPARAAKLTFVSYNWDLLNNYNETEHDESEDIYPMEEFHNELHFVTDDECEDDNVTISTSEFDVEFLDCGENSNDAEIED